MSKVTVRSYQVRYASDTYSDSLYSNHPDHDSAVQAFNSAFITAYENGAKKLAKTFYIKPI